METIHQDEEISSESLSKNRLEDLISNSPTFRKAPKIRAAGKLVDSNTVPKILRRSTTAEFHETLTLDLKNESQVLVIYTGGTIGMVRNNEGALVCLPHAMEGMIRSAITLHDEKYSAKRFKNHLECGNFSKECLLPLVLPHVPDHKRVIYTIYEYDPLLDSSNMTMDDWITIAKDIKNSYNNFDGFVILHGTDTMAYTASALSFMLENLGKPVIVTGSQIPCFETRSDGRDNLIGALILAGNYCIPEVSVYFRHQLMRGNRTVKVSSGDLDAFHSPNMAPIVKAGIDIHVDYRAIHRCKSLSPFTVHSDLNRNVVLLRLFPSIMTDTIAHFLKPPIEGVVLQCYGAGNIPSNRKDILELFKVAADRGVLILSVTQCVNGAVSGLYETGKSLLDAGVLPGEDITPEAALTKLSYVLSKNWTQEQKCKAMTSNLAGEITVLKESKFTKQDDKELGLIKAVADSLKLSTSKEIEGVQSMLYPSLLCAAVYKDNEAGLNTLISKGADVAMADYDHRTPLHVASSEGNLNMVKALMSNGAPLHVRDRNNATPLQCAIDAGHVDVVECLMECGASLKLPQSELGELICESARKGQLARLKCFKAAGVSLDSPNMSQQTALHAAVETGQDEVAQYLLDCQVDIKAKNCLAMTAQDIAKGIISRANLFDMIDRKNISRQ